MSANARADAGPTTALAGGPPKPSLLFFFDARSGRSRRVEGFLAQVLQHRRNHDTFHLYRIDVPTPRPRNEVQGRNSPHARRGRKTSRSRPASHSHEELGNSPASSSPGSAEDTPPHRRGVHAAIGPVLPALLGVHQPRAPTTVPAVR
jgi:hypothetical protein